MILTLSISLSCLTRLLAVELMFSYERLWLAVLNLDERMSVGSFLTTGRNTSA